LQVRVAESWRQHLKYHFCVSLSLIDLARNCIAYSSGGWTSIPVIPDTLSERSDAVHFSEYSLSAIESILLCASS